MWSTLAMKNLIYTPNGQCDHYLENKIRSHSFKINATSGQIKYMFNILQVGEDYKVDWNASKMGMRAMQLSSVGLVIYFFNVAAVCQNCHRNVDRAFLWFAHCSAQMNNSMRDSKNRRNINSYLTWPLLYIRELHCHQGFQRKCKAAR